MPSLAFSDEKAWKLAPRRFIWREVSEVTGTISRGVTLWNKGNPELCGAVYRLSLLMSLVGDLSGTAAQTLLRASNVSTMVQDMAQRALAKSEAYPANLGQEGAWILRKAWVFGGPVWPNMRPSTTSWPPTKLPRHLAMPATPRWPMATGSLQARVPRPSPRPRRHGLCQSCRSRSWGKK